MQNRSWRCSISLMPARMWLNRLNGWIRRCEELRKALAGCHQSARAKFFSAQAVRLIVEYLGEP